MNKATLILALLVAGYTLYVGITAAINVPTAVSHAAVRSTGM